ncbi:hypothetical protein UT300012_22020 [Paraclostridium bifermentans]
MIHLTVNLLNAYRKHVELKGRTSLTAYLKYERNLKGGLVVVPEIIQNYSLFNTFAKGMSGNSKGTCIAILEDGTKIDMLFINTNAGTVRVLTNGKMNNVKSIEINLGGIE